MQFLTTSLEYVLPFLIVLTVLVFIHEMGHYLVARRNGVRVDVFSIGIGPEILGWTDKVGTRWKISLVPLGGYVQMYGDADAASRPDHGAAAGMTDEERSQTLQSKTVGQRIAVVAAGPIANYLLAFFLIAGLCLTQGLPTLSTTISQISPGGVAEKTGLLVGDTIENINGVATPTFEEMRAALQGKAGKTITLTVRRGEKTQTLTAVMMDPQSPESKPVSKLGISPTPAQSKTLSIFESVRTAGEIIWKMSVGTLSSLGQMIMGKRSTEELGGVLAIGDMAKQSAEGGGAALIWFMAVLSINLGLINLLPVPVLDGGHIVFYAIEGIRGKPVSAKAQEYAYTVGLILVVGLMLMSTWNDLMRYKLLSWLPFLN